MSLNPFEFRAGLKPYGGEANYSWVSLNPFEFRAGLKHIYVGAYGIWKS